VIANHMVDPRIVMQPNVGSDRSWVWTAYDYAEGDLHEEVFALKFGKPQDAEEFKAAFDEAKKAMKAFVAGKKCLLLWGEEPSSFLSVIDCRPS